MQLSRRGTRLPDAAAIDIKPIAEHPEYHAALAVLEALEQRLAETETRRKRARARLMGAKPSRGWAERARDLVAGGRIEPTSPADEIAASADEEVILRQGISLATRRLDEVAKDLSFTASQKLQPLHNAALLAVLQAIDDLAAALDAAASIRAALRARGFSPSSVLIPELAPQEAVMIGRSTNVGASPAWYFRRELERLGAL
jgi:hypothetical protein